MRMRVLLPAPLPPRTTEIQPRGNPQDRLSKIARSPRLSETPSNAIRNSGTSGSLMRSSSEAFPAQFTRRIRGGIGRLREVDLSADPRRQPVANQRFRCEWNLRAAHPPGHSGILVQPGTTLRPQRARNRPEADSERLRCPHLRCSRRRPRSRLRQRRRGRYIPYPKRTSESTLRPSTSGFALGPSASAERSFWVSAQALDGDSLESARHARKDRLEGSSNDAKTL